MNGFTTMMTTKTILVVCGFFFCAAILFNVVQKGNRYIILPNRIFNQELKNVSVSRQVNAGDNGTKKKVDATATVMRLREIRIRLSKLLNEEKKASGRLHCELLEIQGKGTQVSNQGGWCKKQGSPDSKHHAFDKPLAAALVDFFKGKLVASFGDGPGLYKQYMDESKKLAYDAYDGAPFGEDTSGGRVKFLDLSAPQYGLPAYDWIISLEVAEHIPAKYESVYLDNIFRHAKEGVVLSWSRPGQGGYSHVNNRPLSYVQDVFLKNGFTWDKNSSVHLQSKATLDWLIKNTNVYLRKSDRPIDVAEL